MDIPYPQTQVWVVLVSQQEGTMSGNQSGMSWRSDTAEVRTDEMKFSIPLKKPKMFSIIGDRLRQKWPEILQEIHQDSRSNKIPVVRLLSCVIDDQIRLKYGKFEVRAV